MMVRPQPHPRALFSLIPDGDDDRARARALAVLAHPDNNHLVSLLPGVFNHKNPEGVEYGLNIGFHIGSKSRYTLATLGRNGDITIEGSNISRIQCSFEIHQDTKEILLYDRSTSRSTQTYGQDAVPFELDRPDRRVVVAEEVNNHFGFGGVGCNLVRFKIHWHWRERPADFEEQISYREDHPRFTRTVEDDTPTALPSKRATRIHTPVVHTPSVHTPGVQGQAKRIRYYKKEKLGRGSFGEVSAAVDVDSGEVFALKLIEWPEHGLQSQRYTMLKREVETLAHMSHVSYFRGPSPLIEYELKKRQPNIVEFISAQGWGEKHLEIITVLKEGNIMDLIRTDAFVRVPTSANSLLQQMLQALDYLAYKGIIHRDVKPENILYTTLPAGGYTFQLTDFGLCNIITEAKTYAGSPIFMAPEMLYNPGTRQTSKVDVWSLFVTLAYTMNAGGFRGKPLNTNELKVRAVQEAANEQTFQPLRDMANVDPNQRASAAEMLDKLFKGEGRTTPRNEIQNSAPAFDKAASSPQLERHPKSSARQPQTQQTAKCTKQRHPPRLRTKAVRSKERQKTLDDMSTSFNTTA